MNTLPHTFLDTAEAVLDKAAGLDLPNLNEANTKALLIEPMLSALGWDVGDLAAVTREYKVYDSTFLDYALLVDSKAVLFCEAKPTGKKLTDPKWVSQTVNYANNEGVVWCLLTDGLHWRVFKANEAVSMDKKLAFEVELADLRDPDKRDRALRLFGCLTPAAVAEGGLAALGTQVFVDGRVREALVTLLEDPGKKLVDALRAFTGTDLSPASIKAALSRIAPDAVDALESQDILPASSAVPGVPDHSTVQGAVQAPQSAVRPGIKPTKPGVKTSQAALTALRQVSFPPGTVLTFDPAGEGRGAELREQLTQWIATDSRRARARVDWDQGKSYLVWEYDGRPYAPSRLVREIARAASGGDPLATNRGTQYWRDANGLRLVDVG